MAAIRRVSPHALLGFATVAACHATPAVVEPDGARPSADAAAAGYRATELQTLPYSANGRQWTIHLERVDRPDGGRTYVEWIPSDTAGAQPAIVLTEPYVGIDWTGEALDARWAMAQAGSNGLCPDVDGPGYTGVETIAYDPETPTSMADQNRLRLLDGAALVMIYGRYYAGGGVRESVADMAAGMWFAAEQPAIDPTRLGIFGASWGGFEALFAAQQADPRARPAVVAAAFPISDVPSWVVHASTRAEPAKDLLVSYLHRIAVAGGDLSGLGVGDLCGALPAATLVLHDEADDLVPVTEPRRWSRRAASRRSTGIARRRRIPAIRRTGRSRASPARRRTRRSRACTSICACCPTRSKRTRPRR